MFWKWKQYETEMLICETDYFEMSNNLFQECQLMKLIIWNEMSTCETVVSKCAIEIDVIYLKQAGEKWSVSSECEKQHKTEMWNNPSILNYLHKNE